MGKSRFRIKLGALTAAVLFISYDPSSAREPASDDSAPVSKSKDAGFRRPSSSWPIPVQPPKNAPNVVIILIDDMGFADPSTFGGLAATPRMEMLAKAGLRYNNFNTAAVCSPTRAALLSGRNHHRVGFGTLADIPAGYPGYNSIWPKNATSLPEILRRRGYSTAAFGKWHNTPIWEISPTGPFDRWPTGLGFEYFYGFMGGHEDQWQPVNLYRNTTPIDAPRTAAQGYQLTADLTDEAINWLRTRQSTAPNKPYLLYFAPGAVHAPHHVPAEWIERYKGAFDKGWDVLRNEIFARQKALGIIPKGARLTPRPTVIPAWKSLGAREKALYARQMEVYAAFVSYTDHEIGRLLEEVNALPGAKNTLVLYVGGDNGAEAGGHLPGVTNGMRDLSAQWSKRDEMGSATVALNLYSAGWAWMGNTPFQWWKSIASHLGSLRNSLIVSWPAVIRQGGAVRSQFTHVTDIAATVLDAADIPFPEVLDGEKQAPLDGVSFVETFTQPDAVSRHEVQYFEIYGNRAIYQNGWMASARHSEPWKPRSYEGYERDRWELYDLTRDFSGSTDLSQSEPKRLAALIDLFDKEAERNQVYPLLSAARDNSMPPVASRGYGTRFTFQRSNERYPSNLTPALTGKSFRIEARLEIPAEGADGVIVSHNELLGGFLIYLKDGYVVYEAHPANGAPESISSAQRVRTGLATLTYEFRRNSSGAANNWAAALGHGRIYLDGRLIGEGNITGPATYEFSSGSLGIGRAFGPQLSQVFSNPFTFTGKLQDVTIILE